MRLPADARQLVVCIWQVACDAVCGCYLVGVRIRERCACCMPLDSALACASSAHKLTGMRSFLFRRSVLTVVDTAQCGPLWSAPVAAPSDCSDSPRSHRAGSTSFGSPAELAMLQEQAQAHVLAQAAANAEALEAAGAAAQPPIGFAVAAAQTEAERTVPSPGAPHAASSAAAGGKAAARHARCRSLDVGSLSGRLDKERQLVAWQLQLQLEDGSCAEASSTAASDAAPSPADASPSTPLQLAARSRHRRSRSATVAMLRR